jgi:MFS family permease
MSFQPASSLKSRTYIGLIIAQFLAAFNDQAIHASAMFFAINRKSLTEAFAISLMPVLFYVPWAAFCTIAGYLADRYSKRDSLVFWKFAEVGITLIALLGFWLGSGPPQSPLGPWIVLLTVFLMGTHSAFFVPAKYGAMPEILQPHLLSRGNGILESASFLAVILGTVCGGVFSFVFKGSEYHIGLILVGLAASGAAASLLIGRIPAANPQRPFLIQLAKLRTVARSSWPVWGWLKALGVAVADVYRPLAANLKMMWQARPLRLSLLGIAFFTFLVAYMRGTVYMHGEAHGWTESKTSLIVGATAVGVSIGGLLAGFFSGGKIELGLVPIGAVGMILFTLVAAIFLNVLSVLTASIMLIGFFAGFYTLPLFALLQHRAPKTSKGDSIAASNFVNVVGGIAASGLLLVLGWGAELVGLAPPLPMEDFPQSFFQAELKDKGLRLPELQGELVELVYEDGRPRYFEIEGPDPVDTTGKKKLQTAFKVERSDHPWPVDDPLDDIEVERIQVASDLFDLAGYGLRPRVMDEGGNVVQEGSLVIITTFRQRGVNHFLVRAANKPVPQVYDNEPVPRYLFAGSAVMTVGVLLALWMQLPDFFLRSWTWLHSLGRYRLQVVGVNYLPTDGPAVLAMSCGDVEGCLHVLSVTDRTTHFFVLDRTPASRLSAIGRFLARGSGLTMPLPDPGKPPEWEGRIAWAASFLKNGQFLALPVGEEGLEMLEEQFLRRVEGLHPAVILPVYHSQADRFSAAARTKGAVPVQLVIGAPMPAGTPFTLVRRELIRLAEWSVQRAEDGDVPATTLMIPRAEDALPTGPAADLPARPS